MKRLLMVLWLFGVGLGIGGCLDVSGEVEHDHNIPEDISISVDFLLEDALLVLDPFAEVGIGIDPSILDDEEVYCNILGDCVTAKDFRDAAKFMLENLVAPN